MAEADVKSKDLGDSRAKRLPPWINIAESLQC